jgi:hypothetical protein
MKHAIILASVVLLGLVGCGLDRAPRPSLSVYSTGDGTTMFVRLNDEVFRYSDGRNFNKAEFASFVLLQQIIKLQERIRDAEGEIESARRGSFTDSTRREFEANLETKESRLRQEIAQNRLIISATVAELEKIKD